MTSAAVFLNCEVICMSNNSLSIQRQVLRIDDHTAQDDWDEVVVEHPLQVSVPNGTSFSLSCSPEHMDELVVGALFNRGFITSSDNLEELVFSPDSSQVEARLIPSPAQIHRPHTPGLQLTATVVYELMAQNLKASALFQRTGGVHCVSLYLPDHPLIYREDLARHNAVDKIVGHALLQRLPLQSAALVVSGRLSSDMLEKAALAGIPVVLSKGAPTDLAIRLAQEHGMTLAGFIRGSRMNIYAGPERISYL